MKKIFMILMVAALALALASPAMALKLTTKGYMDVTGIFLSGNVVDRGTTSDLKNDSSNAWYQMELVIDPVLHINDKVRIHGRVTIMERNWVGGESIGNSGLDHRGANDFWWEHIYLSFPLTGGTMYVGRMGGGKWGYVFNDTDDNRDRIKYIRKFGHVTLLGIIEKLSEGDGGSFLTTAPVAGDSFTQVHSDIDAYALGAVVPFSKNILWRPLLYYISYEPFSGTDLIVMNALTIKSGNFKLDTEINARKRDWSLAGAERDVTQWSGWVDAGMTFGPAELAIGGFLQQGNKETTDPKKNKTVWGVGGDFEPYFLLFSEDVGLLWNSAGVANGALGGASGFQSFYVRGSYKISDAMKLSGIFGHLRADKMVYANVSKDIGNEIDLRFEWKFMPNIAYVIDAGYLMAGGYGEDYTKNVLPGGGVDLTNDVFGVRHMLVINW
jgi:hypothetical protein